MLPISLKITNVNATRQVADIQISVQKDYRQLVYLGKPAAHQVPISYIGMPETSSRNINIQDINDDPLQVRIKENSTQIRYLRIFKDKVFDLPNRHAHITNVVLEDPSGNVLPLFWKHIIEGGFSAPPEVLDQDMQKVPEGSYKLVVSNSEIALYHDLAPSVDASTGRMRIFYIRYTTSAGVPKFGLLATTPVFREATLNDWPYADKRLYTIRELAGKFRYRVLYGGLGPFHVRVGDSAQIKLRAPALARSTEPWYLSITDGELFGETDSGKEKYSIPEYHFQNFSPVEPTQYTGVQECQILSANVAVLPFENLLVGPQHQLDILVTDESLAPKFGFTSNPSTERQFWIDSVGRWRAAGLGIIKYPLQDMAIAGVLVNAERGILHLPIELLPTDRVFVRAHKNSHDFVYMNLNLNPLHNRSLVGGRALVYVRPESELDASRIAIHHLILDLDDAIIDWSDPRLGEEDLIPVYGESEDSNLATFLSENPKVLLLGFVTISREASLNDLAFIDVREKGGGLTDEIQNNLSRFLPDYPELMWLAEDSIEGRSVPLLGAFLLDLPFSLLEEGGGLFTRDAVRAIVERHISLGAFPVINYYSDVPVVKKAVYVDNVPALVISFTTVPSADSYRLYVSDGADKTFVPIELYCAPDQFFDDAVESIISFLGSGTPAIEWAPENKLFFYVTPVRDGHELPTSQMSSIDLTVRSNSVNFMLSAVIDQAPSLTFDLDAVIIGE
jgi:hypothetical protein